jgi:hypothetical protein
MDHDLVKLTSVLTMAAAALPALVAAINSDGQRCGQARVRRGRGNAPSCPRLRGTTSLPPVPRHHQPEAADGG